MFGSPFEQNEKYDKTIKHQKNKTMKDANILSPIKGQRNYKY